MKISGEAYLEVIHNVARPFKVEVNNQVIEDIGTHFNINSYADEPQMITTLLQGSVKISRDDQIALFETRPASGYEIIESFNYDQTGGRRPGCCLEKW